MVSIEYLDLKFPEYSYTIDEIVDDIFGEKLDDEIKNFVKNKIGIDKVYKSFDLRKIDVNGTDYIKPDVKLNDLFELVGKKALESAGKNPNDIGLLSILSSNQQYLMPAPTVEMVSRLGLSSDVRTQNIQGMACSAFSEAIRKTITIVPPLITTELLIKENSSSHPSLQGWIKNNLLSLGGIKDL